MHSLPSLLMLRLHICENIWVDKLYSMASWCIPFFLLIELLVLQYSAYWVIGAPVFRYMCPCLFLFSLSSFKIAHSDMLAILVFSLKNRIMAAVKSCITVIQLFGEMVFKLWFNQCLLFYLVCETYLFPKCFARTRTLAFFLLSVPVQFECQCVVVDLWNVMLPLLYTWCNWFGTEPLL
jgi:hypothetical protein